MSHRTVIFFRCCLLLNERRDSLRTDLHTRSVLADVVDAISCYYCDDADSFASLVNARNAGGMTALHYAAVNGRLEALQVLTAKDATPYAVDDAGRSLAHCIAGYCSVRDGDEVVSAVVAELDRPCPALEACMRWLTHAAPEVLDWGDGAGNTALHIAAQFGYVLAAWYMALYSPQQHHCVRCLRLRWVWQTSGVRAGPAVYGRGSPGDQRRRCDGGDTSRWLRSHALLACAAVVRWNRGCSCLPSRR